MTFQIFYTKRMSLVVFEYFVGNLGLTKGLQEIFLNLSEYIVRLWESTGKMPIGNQNGPAENSVLGNMKMPYYKHIQIPLITVSPLEVYGSGVILPTGWRHTCF